MDNLKNSLIDKKQNVLYYIFKSLQGLCIMEDKMKTSLFGYSKKSVELLQDEYKSKTKLLNEENSKLKKDNEKLSNENKLIESRINELSIKVERSYILLENEQRKSSALAEENTELKKRLERAISELEATTKELFEIKKQSSDFEITQKFINNNSKLITKDIVKDSYDFEEIIKSLKDCNNEMKKHCDKAENIFNDAFIKFAEFIINANNSGNDSKDPNSSHHIAG